MIPDKWIPKKKRKKTKGAQMLRNFTLRRWAYGTDLLGTTFTQENLRRCPQQQPHPEVPPPKLGDPASSWFPATATPGSTVWGRRRSGCSSEWGPPSACWARSLVDHFARMLAPVGTHSMTSRMNSPAGRRAACPNQRCRTASWRQCNTFDFYGFVC